MNTVGLVLLLVVAQAPPPVPRKITGEAGNRANQSYQQTKTRKVVPDSLPFENADHASATEDSTKNNASEEKQYRVVVERLPQKDRLDKAYVLLTGALALAGFLTFLVVGYQAIETKKAASAALSAAKAALKQIQITTEKERPRISVEVELVRLKDLGVSGVSYIVDCWCPTPAFIINAWVHLGFTEKPSWRMSIPLDPQVRETMRVRLQVKLMDPVTQETIDEIEAGNRVLLFYGAVSYRGVHLSPHDPPYRTSFRWRWNAHDLSDDPDFGIDFSNWTRDGDEADNERS